MAKCFKSRVHVMCPNVMSLYIDILDPTNSMVDAEGVNQSCKVIDQFQNLSKVTGKWTGYLPGKNDIT